MCSVNWRVFDSHIALVFSRDESVLRDKAQLPQIYNDGRGDFLMPKDPVGNGSWIAANQAGFVFFLLNDYQGVLKPVSPDLVSRGLLVRSLASCQSLDEVQQFISNIVLAKSQPFYLAMLSHEHQLCWHFDGKVNALQASPLAQQLYSSGYPEAAKIIQARHRYVSKIKIVNDQQLIRLHQSHQPCGDDQRQSLKNQVIDQQTVGLSYPICMHRAEAKTQSLTHITLSQNKVKMKYWDGQPCLTDQYYTSELTW